MEYKLIKKYPSLPKDWEIGMIIGQGDRGTYADFSPCNGKYSNSYIICPNVVNYPEFWQPVIEKDYEILSFTDLFSKNIMKKHQNNNFGIVWGEYTEKDQLDKLSQGKKIHSVKRLSDSQIFTIGDIINTRVDDKYKQEILEINLGINNNFLKDKLIFKTKAGYVVIEIAVKTKQPLFTTEDGVDIFEGDKYWCAHNENFGVISMKWTVNNTPYIATNNIIYDYNTIEGKQKLHQHGNFFFSTKEKAEEYILMNKPVLSLNDLKQFFPDTYIPFKKGESATEDINTQQLEDLVKSKIQQSV